ncbi:MAG: PIN domain-containing protein, partial [Nitrosopumilus sp.]|nr:PIN domain-containing protein [Nitrosopumilus sp.]
MTGILVADTSVIINGNLAEQIESGSIRDFEIIIPQAVFDELQSQASNRKEQGFIGLEQIQKLNRLSENYGLKIILKGSHPAIDDIKFAASGRIDALIIDIAKQNDAILYTSDNVQHLVAQAEDVQTVFLKPKIIREELEFLKFFDSTTMSIH